MEGHVTFKAVYYRTGVCVCVCVCACMRACMFSNFEWVCIGYQTMLKKFAY